MLYSFQFCAEVFKLGFYLFAHYKYHCFIVYVNTPSLWSPCDSAWVACCFSWFWLMVSYSPVCPSSVSICWTFILPQLPCLQTSHRKLRVKDENSRDCCCQHSAGSCYYSKSSEKTLSTELTLGLIHSCQRLLHSWNLLTCAGARGGGQGVRKKTLLRDFYPTASKTHQPRSCLGVRPAAFPE